jgi:hypothetical protein
MSRNTRLSRLGAAYVNAGPPVAALFPFIGAMLAGEGRGMGGLGLLLVFGAWCGVAALAVSVANAWLILRRKQTLGLAYFELVYECESSLRLLFGQIAVLLTPCLLLLGAGVENEGDYSAPLAWGLPLAAVAINWLFWLGPSGRTLGDRLGGARVVRVGERSAARAFAARPLWPDVLLLGPPLLLLPLAAEFHGGAAGDVVAIVALACPIVVTRLRA